LQSQDLDLQHSVIEYSEQEDGFVLQDLNTAKTYKIKDFLKIQTKKKELSTTSDPASTSVNHIF
jgi:hypothetical protein